MKAAGNNLARVGLIGLCIVASGSSLLAATNEVDISKLPPPPTKQIDFARDIQPIFESSCLRCHGPQKPKSGFRLDNRVSALKGGDKGVDILPGNSAGSTLVQFCAYLVEDDEMPPVGKGKQLTPEQVGLLRAWIDQGVKWDAGAPANSTEFSVTPVLGGTAISGDEHRFQEHYWQRNGLNGGVEDFEFSRQTDPDTRVVLSGHALVDDYKINLSADRDGVGFVHAGWQQFRKYYDDTGGYFPRFSGSVPTLNKDLFLDDGKAWIDFGLTLPHWPEMVLGYEYDYRQGNEALTDWGAFQQPGGARSSVNILPDSENIHEGTHIIKFDLNTEVKGAAIEDRFRGEFYNLDTSRTNLLAAGISGGSTNITGFNSEKVNETTHYFQGANTFTVEKKFTDWLSASAGYLYSKLDADSSFQRNLTPVVVLVGATPATTELLAPDLMLSRESHVVNLNGIIGPFAGLSLSGGVQSEWTHQEGFGDATLSSLAPTLSSDPAVLSSSYDETSISESAGLRYTSIPFTVLFADGRLQEETIGQSDEFALNNPADPNNLDRSDFLQRTDFSNFSYDARVGMSASPWRFLSFDAHYRISDDDSHYNNRPLQQPVGVPAAGYPGFITARDVHLDEVQALLTLRPCDFFKTTLSYQFMGTRFNNTTLAAIPFTPGGELISGEQDYQIYSISTTMSPTRRLFLNTTFSYQPTTTMVATTSPAIAPYRGAVYSAIVSGTCVFSESTDLFANYSFSDANYGDNNNVASTPLGIQYQQHTVQVGIVRRLSKNVSTKLQYAFDYYNEPSLGNAGDYRAHAIFGAVTFRLP